jgi:DNA-directed RNA polymerase subunit B'
VVDSVRGGAVEEDASLIGDLVTHGVVDKVVKYSSPKTNGMRVKIRLREDREPTVGDKFSSRHGQKGIVGRLVNNDIPFLPDGSVPDLIINPHLPSRMTIGHLLESIGAKSSCLDHKFTDATPLTGVEIMSSAIGYKARLTPDR